MQRNCLASSRKYSVPPPRDAPDVCIEVQLLQGVHHAQQRGLWDAGVQRACRNSVQHEGTMLAAGAVRRLQLPSAPADKDSASNQ